MFSIKSPKGYFLVKSDFILELIWSSKYKRTAEGKTAHCWNTRYQILTQTVKLLCDTGAGRAVSEEQNGKYKGI